MVILNYSSNFVGGAPKRYFCLFSYFNEFYDNTYLIINEQLYKSLSKLNINIPNENVILIRESKDFPFRLRMGRIKPFITGLIKWIKFSVVFLRTYRQKKIKYVFGVYTGGIYASLWKKILKFYFIYSYNDSSLSSLDANFLRLFDSELNPLKKADKIDFLSAGLVSLIENRIGPIKKDKISISPNSFIYNSLYFSPNFEKTIDVVFASRLTHYKNPIIFIEAITLLKRKLKDFDRSKFVLLGDGPLLDECRSLKLKNGLNNLYIPGAVHNVYEYMNCSKIFVSLQQTNNYPSQSLLEAMSSGNAIIASDVGETRLLVSEKEGILVSLKPEEIAEAIVTILNDPEKRVTMGVNAREKIVAKHNIQNYFQYFNHLFPDVVTN
jgi:glycosyltransferase involved in cell wall biosynthesis